MIFSFDLDSMILILNLDLIIVKIYLHPENEVPRYKARKL